MIDAVPAPVTAARPQPRWWLPVVVLLVGVGGGVLTEWLQGEPADPWAAWANSVAAWCLAATAVGALAARAGLAAAAGVVTELLLVGGYYAAQYVQLLPVRTGTVVGWLVAGVLAGVVFGVAGSWWRTGDRLRALAGTTLVGGVLVAEGSYRAVAFPWQGSAGAVMAGVGVVLVLLLGRSWRDRLTVLALLLAVVPAGWLGTRLVDLAFTTW
jgi:hypothetical protein